jgi:hypothetical protein
MKCPLCKATDAGLREEPDVWHLHCTVCGNLRFTSTAYVEVGSLTDHDKSLLAEYCRRYSGDPEFPTITHMRLPEMVEKMSVIRATELLRAELNKKEKR